jgi:hypothetical protein
MKRVMKQLALAGLFAGGVTVAGTALAGATVTFADPEKFADVPYYGPDRELMMSDLREHIEKLAEGLPAGASLRVEFLDIDLAGRLKPWYFGQQVRVTTGRADFPFMRLRYSLERDGKVIRAGEMELLDMSYMDKPNHYTLDERLRYEKAMLDNWFKKTIQLG